ncbi:CU044_5270 family protein [Actinomadura luteofluorescens]
MDDLQLLEAALTKPEPSAETLDRRRHQLQNTMRGPVRTHRSRRPMLAIGATAAAGTVAVAVAATGALAPGSAHKDRTTTAEMSGSQVLLVAATTAETKPAASGTYWHVKNVGATGTAQTFESWTTTDGRRWVRVQGGAVTKLPGRHPITVRRTHLRMEQVAKLPASPSALKARLLGSATVPAKDSKNPAVRETLTIMLLENLLSEVPAPPKVRAAALRALASLPDVKNLGRVPGGQSLQFSGQGGGTKLVVDPKTSAVSGEGYADINGRQESMGQTTTTAAWTNEPPR